MAFSTFAASGLLGVSGSLSLSASAGVADLLEGGVADLLDGEGLVDLLGLFVIGEVDLLGLLGGVRGPREDLGGGGGGARRSTLGGGL